MAAVALACATLGWAGLNLGSVCRAADAAAAPQAPSDLPTAVQEVVKLAKAGLSEEVLLAKIKNDGVSYNLTTDQIIYLSGAGVSQNVITALMQTKPGGGPATPAAAGATNSAPAAAAQAEPPPLDATPAGPTAPAPAAAPTTAPAPALAPAPAATAPAPIAMAPAPAGVAPAPVGMAPAPGAMPPQAAPAGLIDNFTSDLGLNRALWTPQSDLLMRFAAVKGCRLFLPALAFGPGGMQMSGLSGPGQMMGVQSLGVFTAPFNFSATAVGMIAHGVPFEVSLVSADLRQWVTIAGHLGGQGAGGDVRVVGRLGGIFRARVETPVVESSPYYGVWLNYTGSGQPISGLGYKLYEVPMAGVPYSVQVSAGADGTASVALLNSAGATLAARNGLAVGPGPFYVLLAERDGPAYANWQLAQLTPLAPAPVAMAVPATPTLDYFRDQLTPYGQWVEVPGAGLCWQPVVPGGWRPYYDGGHWVYTDEGWYWQSEYPWGDLAFHYGRWSFNPAFGWIWAPGFELRSGLGRLASHRRVPAVGRPCPSARFLLRAGGTFAASGSASISISGCRRVSSASSLATISGSMISGVSSCPGTGWWWFSAGARSSAATTWIMATSSTKASASNGWRNSAIATCGRSPATRPMPAT